MMFVLDQLVIRDFFSRVASVIVFAPIGWRNGWHMGRHNQIPRVADKPKAQGCTNGQPFIGCAMDRAPLIWFNVGRTEWFAPIAAYDAESRRIGSKRAKAYRAREFRWVACVN
jgi:hypothetical protein